VKVRSLLASGVTVERKPADVPPAVMAEVDRELAALRVRVLERVTEKPAPQITMAEVDAAIGQARESILASVRAMVDGVRSDMTEGLRDVAVQIASIPQPKETIVERVAEAAEPEPYFMECTHDREGYLSRIVAQPLDPESGAPAYEYEIERDGDQVKFINMKPME
jgi:hypothetical protein